VSARQHIVTDKSMEQALPAAFLAKISPEPNTGCWLWAASWNTTGYGNFWWEKRCHTAHRFIYERLFGSQDGNEIDHLCRTPCCVNPVHLESVTVKVNNDRRIGLGKGNRKKTHCRFGHPLSGENLDAFVTPEGHRKRRCRICRNANQRAFTARGKTQK
jgi:hypothetical protein